MKHFLILVVVYVLNNISKHVLIFVTVNYGSTYLSKIVYKVADYFEKHIRVDIDGFSFLFLDELLHILEVIDHLLDKACVVVLAYGLLEAVEDLANVQWVENYEWEVFYIFLHLVVAIVAGL